MDMTRRPKAPDTRAGAADSLRRLVSRAADLREREGQRISHELHEGVNQKLAALRLELSSLALDEPSDTVRKRIAAMLTVLDESMASLRRISSDLRPAMLDDLGLHAAVEWLAREAARNMDIEVTVRLGEHEPLIDEQVATAIYRITQEALSNVGQHAKATDVQIALQPKDDGIQLTIQDNGVGFPERAMKSQGGLGLMGARERAVMLGGRLDVQNPPGQGGRMTVWLPRHPRRSESSPDPVANP